MQHIFHSKEQGFAAFFLSVILFTVAFAVAISISLLTLFQQQVGDNASYSAQAYYAAESGLEDALLRVSKGMSFVEDTPYSFMVENAVAGITISSVLVGARTIAVEGDRESRIRKTEAVYELDSSTPGLFYGAQVGDAGLNLQNDATVDGNIFSSGNMIAQNGSRVIGTVKIASVGNSIQGGIISGDAYADSCGGGAHIMGSFYGQSEACTIDGSFVSQAPPSPISLPIPLSQIDEWKQDAEAGGIIGTQQIQDADSVTLGPVRINGDLTVQNDAELIITGTI